MLELLYGHRCSTVLRNSGVPPSVPRTYNDRGWPWYERCVTDSKPNASMNIFEFGTEFDPDGCDDVGVGFLLRHQEGQGPPCSLEVFKEGLQERAELARTRAPPHNKVFTNDADESFVINKYGKIWAQMSTAGQLSYHNCTWTDMQLQSFAKTLSSLADLKGLEIRSTFLGPTHGAAIVASLHSNCEVLSLGGREGGGEKFGWGQTQRPDKAPTY